MSKSKMKKRVSGTRNKNTVKDSQAKYKWSKPKDFNFIPPVKFLPGFRSGKHWKRIVAMTYYCATPAAIFFKFMDFRYFGVFLFIMLLTIPFIVFSIASFVKTKDKYYAVEALISAAVLGADNLLLVYFMRRMLESLS